MSEKGHDGKVVLMDIKTEMQKDFLEYAMSVIVSRALPDLKDGLKPVHRRIIYAMNDLGITHDKPHKKSARIVGEVIGKYHPHGDSSVYEAMVRMAQDFSYRYPLVDGHGNFGSIDGDGAAAMRYTEARLSKVSALIIKDIDMDTIPFIDNYDASETEPGYLPGYLPNLLANGATGIAVGMATNIPPHNLKELLSAIIAYINNNEITIDEMLNYIKGPDFPTGALMTNGHLMREGYRTGRGSLTVRARIDIDETEKNKRLIITEIPYQTNKARIIERIAELAKTKTIQEISDLRDESNYEGIRVVIELKRDANAQMVINKLYKMTNLQINFSINMVALNNGVPLLMDLKKIIKNYVSYQIQIILRRTIFEKNKLQKKLHILTALGIALDNIDKIIEIIRNSKTNDIAKEKMTSAFGFDDEQNKAILEMRLQRLVGLEREKIIQEISDIKIRIEVLDKIIASPEEQNQVLVNQLNEISNKFGDNRRTEIIDEISTEIDNEELIADSKMIITLSKEGYIRRIEPNDFKIQKRGGRGIIVNDRETDPITVATMGKTRDDLLLFTDKGKVYRIKAYNVTQFSRTSRGLPIINYINITKDETVTSILPFRDRKNKYKFLTFVTKGGIVKRTPIEEFALINQSGKITIKLKENDELISVIPTNGENDLIIGTYKGKVTRISEDNINILSRSSFGVKGISLDKEDFVIGSCTNFNSNLISTISDRGSAKKTSVSEYKILGRNSKGVKAMNLNEKTGFFKSILSIRETDTIVMISSKGNLIKIPVSELPLLSRNTQGVKGFRLNNDEVITAVTLEWQKNK
ncbi:DNA gyrase subunit A [Spiroplasma sabaudiense Ar-1343]|uniref:DNA topoisomerase (ATP-hydrolyzing) n=1 Tax=Spiroplasma sabaudiense Ar-1343 TaxID=1276257 RepID=W6A8X4_9MOLU|nr:DNA gyrase subunit A [Spiroplasma sabaudiense]AHI53416.1 DNA gyrase subunit A [Spiroplasma sabaudiense Ar-1343]